MYFKKNNDNFAFDNEHMLVKHCVKTDTSIILIFHSRNWQTFSNHAC